MKRTTSNGTCEGDDVYVPIPRVGDTWPSAFRGVIASLKVVPGKAVVCSPDGQTALVPLNRLRKPSFAVTGEGDDGYVCMDDYPVAQRTDFLVRLADMVATGVAPSLIVAGDPGIGKTFTVMERTRLAVKESELTVIKGKVSPLGLYRALYFSNNKLIVFDDADSVFDDKDSVTLLKASLDSYDKRVVSWHSQSAVAEGLPTDFLFTGRAVFITNRDITRLDAAVLDRSFRINITMNNDEVLERLSHIYTRMETSVDVGIRKEVLDYLVAMGDRLAKISFRTMINAVRLRMSNPDKWQEMVPLFA